MKAKLELTGQKFGRLTVLSESHQNKYGGWYWNCECDCGNMTVVSVGHLRDGHTKSCGCLNRERITKHGMYYTPEYQIWQAMIQRCFNPKYKTYAYYGGRGISVCEHWLKFENFYEDMGKRPAKNLTLERTNNEKGYSLDNCIWANWLSQSRNKRLSKRNTSGHIGVFWNDSRKKWIARIMANYKPIHLGCFVNLSDAIEARKMGEIKHWGKI